MADIMGYKEEMLCDSIYEVKNNVYAVDYA